MMGFIHLQENDMAVAQELEPYEAERFRSVGRHLELMWNFNQVMHMTGTSAYPGSY